MKELSGGDDSSSSGVGLYSWAVKDEATGRPLPVHGVGHSMGSLLHLLSCSLFGNSDRASNVLLAFNNKPVGDAVPVSRDALAGAARAALDFSAAAAALGNATLPSGSSRPGLPPPSSLSSKSLLDGALGALAAAGVRVPEAARAALADAAPAIDQLGSVAVEMASPSRSGGGGGSGSGSGTATNAASAGGAEREGGVEFVPSPEESRALIERNYSVPRTLLVRFENDTIDETPSMAALLRRVNAAGVSVLTLPGSHVTPCGGELPSSSGSSSASSLPSAVDLFALGGAALLQADARRLAASVLDWLDKVPRGGVGGGAAALPPPGA